MRIFKCRKTVGTLSLNCLINSGLKLSPNDTRRMRYAYLVKASTEKLNAGKLKAERIEKFNQLQELGEKNTHVKQYQ